MDRNEFEKDRAIDPARLDIEAVRQPDVFFKWAELAVRAKGEVERLRLGVDVLEAKLQFKVRDNPEDFGLTKVTEAAVVASVRCCPEFVGACEALLEAKQASALLDSAVTAMEQRKRMLEVLVTLHGQQYFAGPAVPHDLAKTWQEYQEDRGAKLNERQLSRARERKGKGDTE